MRDDLSNYDLARFVFAQSMADNPREDEAWRDTGMHETESLRDKFPGIDAVATPIIATLPEGATFGETIDHVQHALDAAFMATGEGSSYISYGNPGAAPILYDASKVEFARECENDDYDDYGIRGVLKSDPAIEFLALVVPEEFGPRVRAVNAWDTVSGETLIAHDPDCEPATTIKGDASRCISILERLDEAFPRASDVPPGVELTREPNGSPNGSRAEAWAVSHTPENRGVWSQRADPTPLALARDKLASEQATRSPFDRAAAKLDTPEACAARKAAHGRPRDDNENTL